MQSFTPVVVRPLFYFIYLFFIYLFILPHPKYNENSKRKNIKNGFNNGGDPKETMKLIFIRSTQLLFYKMKSKKKIRT